MPTVIDGLMWAPEPPDPELSAYLRGWSEDHDYDVRADLGGT